MATLTPKKLYHGRPGTTVATLYTVPASTTTHLKQIVLTNLTNAAAYVTLYLVASAGSASDDNVLLGTFYVPAYSSTDPGRNTVVLSLICVLSAAETIQGLQGTANAVVVRIDGVEVV